MNEREQFLILVPVCSLMGHGSYVMHIDSRFDSTRMDEPYLVEFYAPWCGHCKKLEPEYERVGAMLDGTGIKIAKIDATMHSDVAGTYEVRGFPTIIYVQGEKVVEYKGDRTADDIARFAVRCRSPPIHPLYSIGGLRDRLRQETNDAFFVYIGDEHHHIFNDYREAAQNHSVNFDFYHAEPGALKQEVADDAKLPMVLVYKDGRRFKFDPMKDSNIAYWVEEERYTAMQSTKGAMFHELMKMDKMLIIMVVPEKSDDKIVKENSKRAIDGARSTSLDRNLRQFQFVLMERPDSVSSILLSSVPVPCAIAFHPITHLYYVPEKPVEEMNSQDWVDFLTGIITARLKPEGGKGFFRQMRRAIYGLTSSVLELWVESRLLFAVVVVLPIFVVSLVVYTLCCTTWDEEEADKEEHEEDSEGSEGEESEGEPQNDQDTGHLKSE